MDVNDLKSISDLKSAFLNLSQSKEDSKLLEDTLLDYVVKEIQIMHDEVSKEDTEHLVRSIRDFDMKVVPLLLDMIRCLLTINDNDALITYFGLADHITTPSNNMIPRIIIYLERKYPQSEYPDLHLYIDRISETAYAALSTMRHG